MSSPTAPPNQPMRLLIVEDDANDVRLMLDVLERSGLRVLFEVAATPEEFRSLLAFGGYDIILSDYNLRGWNGAGALEMLRSTDRKIPFILVTGSL